MIRLSGLFKVVAVLMFDFLVVDTLFHNAQAAAAVTGVIALYIWLRFCMLKTCPFILGQFVRPDRSKKSFIYTWKKVQKTH